MQGLHFQMQVFAVVVYLIFYYFLAFLSILNNFVIKENHLWFGKVKKTEQKIIFFDEIKNSKKNIHKTHTSQPYFKQKRVKQWEKI